jgi:predicted molibdopterin-dependent oxidoreductase YjgC
MRNSSGQIWPNRSVQHVLYICYCAMQCHMELQEFEDGNVTVKPLEHPINKNKRCVLGQNSAKFFNHSERLTTPLVRVARAKPSAART